MRVLLDTHAVIWATIQPAHMSQKTVPILLDEQNEICVSAASAWEIATKVRLGKLPEAVALEGDFLHYMRMAGYSMLPITAALALRSARLPGEHRDPFDRMIAAHALAEDIAVISADPKLDAFGVRRIW